MSIPTTRGLERREFLQLLGAAGAAGAVGWPAIGSAFAVSELPAGTLIIGMGGAGCKVVRRIIGFGYDPGRFAALDADGDDLAGSGAAHLIETGTRSPWGGYHCSSDQWARAAARIDGLMHSAAKVVLVAGLGGHMGGPWLVECAVAHWGLTARHMAARGSAINVVTTMPRNDEPIQMRIWAETLLGTIRAHPAVNTRFAFQDDWRYGMAPRPALGSLPERELWLTRSTLISAVTKSDSETTRSLAT